MQQANIINIITNKYEPQQKHRLGTVSKKKITGGLKRVLQAPNLRRFGFSISLKDNGGIS